VTELLATLARGVVIAAVAFVCVITYTVGALRRLAIRDRDARAKHRCEQRGRLLRWCFVELGGTFVKIGQVASSRPDLFSCCVIAQLRTLQDHVPPFRLRRVDIDAEIDPVPLAAGSIAQVHRGVLPNGEEVAIKVLRPNIRARVRRDAKLLLWLAHVAHAVSPRAKAADVIGHVRSLVGAIIAQTDLTYEAQNYERFRADFACDHSIAFPRVLRATRDVLVMELVTGVPIEAVAPKHAVRVSRAVRDAFLAMCFEHGLVHADLHPGNILVRADGVVVLLDVGLVKALSREAIDMVVDLARCMVVGDAFDLVAHLKAHYHQKHATDWAAVGADARDFIADLRRRSLAELEVSAFAGRLFALARKHGIRPLPELTLVLLGMVTIEGIIKRLDPAMNVLGEVARFLGPRLAGDQRLARGSRTWIHVEAARPKIRPRDASFAPIGDRHAASARSRRGIAPRRP